MFSGYRSICGDERSVLYFSAVEYTTVVIVKRPIGNIIGAFRKMCVRNACSD